MRPYFTRFLGAVVFLLAATASRADDWPQWLGPQRDGVWRETGVIETIPAAGLKPAWRVPVGGGYAGPAVAGGRVYVTDRVLAAGVKNPSNPFSRDAVAGEERVLCLDAASGRKIWEYGYPCKYTISYAAGPRCTPVVSGGKVWTLGAMGDLVCLDAAEGKLIWSKNLPKEYDTPVPLWGYAAHPLLDGDKLICLVGGKGSVAVAFDKDTGKERWRSLSMSGEPSPPKGEIGYCPPVIFQVGKTRQLIIWHSQAANGLDPETGKVYWTVPIDSGASMTIPTPRLAGDRLFLTSFYGGSTLIQLSPDNPASASVVWHSKLSKSNPESPKNTDKLHCVMSTPFIKDGFIYGVCSYGQLRCIRLDDGGRVWEDMRATGSAKEPVERWANAFLIQHGDRVFIPNEKGDLIIARLSPSGYDEIGRVHLMDPTGLAMGRKIVWSHPAFANRCMYARNDKEIICVPLAANAAQ
jgi:outer membrane protein assembly factor BamB